MSTTMWPISRRRAVEAAVDLARSNEAAADPGAEREHHHLGRARAPRPRAPRRAPRSWRRCRRPPAARGARPSCRETDVVQREVDGLDRHARCAGRTCRGCRSRPRRPRRRGSRAPPRRRRAPSPRAPSGRGRAQGGWYGDGRSVGVHGAGQQLGAAEIDADHASLGHAGHLTPPPHGRRRRPPDYTHLQSAPAVPAAAATSDGAGPARRATARARGARPPATLRRARGRLRRERGGGPPARLTLGRVARVARLRGRRVGAALASSLFLISAQIQESKISDAAERRARRRRLHAHLAEHDPGARLRRPHQGHQGARRERDRRGRRGRTRSC